MTHVALALGAHEVVHAYGRVEIASLDPATSFYAPELGRSWLGFARAPLSGVATRRPLPA